jgi:hypothetical protein
LGKIGESSWESVYEKNTETKYAETLWPVYEPYELRGIGGFWCISASRPSLRNTKRFVDPLSPKDAGIFLEFARWFDTHKMDKGVNYGLDATLGTARNGDAALVWAHEYGVLGLGINPGSDSAVGGGLVSSSSQIAARRLGTPELGHEGTRAYRMSAEGGKHETVERFVLEACEANVVLKLYEAATAPEPNTHAIERFMSSESSSAPSERETWTQDADYARRWALAVVDEAVTRKTERDVYRIVLGEPYSYKEGWGFKSLLGAMWLQMQNFMLGENNRCDWCGDLYYKSRRDKDYCTGACARRASADRSYKRKKQRQQEARKATRRRLQR